MGANTCLSNLIIRMSQMPYPFDHYLVRTAKEVAHHDFFLNDANTFKLTTTFVRNLAYVDMIVGNNIHEGYPEATLSGDQCILGLRINLCLVIPEFHELGKIAITTEHSYRCRRCHKSNATTQHIAIMRAQNDPRGIVFRG